MYSSGVEETWVQQSHYVLKTVFRDYDHHVLQIVFRLGMLPRQVGFLPAVR
jgi:hypothetical protein